MTRTQKPSVFQVGRIWDDGRTVVVSGWGIGLCSVGCPCHRSPTGGHLSIDEDATGGTLGLRSFGSEACSCCEPWTADELSAIVRDLERVSTLDAQEPLAG